MIQRQLDNRQPVPWWAAIGAPLVGVPLLVGLLALASPKADTSGEIDSAVTVEQIDLQPVEQEISGEESEHPMSLS